MSFSFRSMFQGTADPNQQGDATAMIASGGEEFTPAVPAMMSVPSPSLNGASPFGAPMFKVAHGEPPLPAGSSSPFAVMNSQGTSALMTVADVLPQLPPEIARAGALPPGQPVAISSQVLDEALRSGRAAVPLFEIYRVCPALFQTPVSPQDPRLVPLPASKLPRLIAASQSGREGEQPQASPFSAMSPAGGGGNTMEMPIMIGDPGNIQLPPRRQGPPPPLADVPGRDAMMPSLSLPPNGGMGAVGPAFPMSPFAAVGAEMSGPAPMNATPSEVPFQTPEMTARMPGASPFGFQQEGASTISRPLQAPAPGAAMASPFSATPAAPVAAPLSPFAAAAPAIMPSPGAAGGSPFGVLFGNKAVPTGQPAPDAMPGGPRLVSAPHGMTPAPAEMPGQATPPTAGPARIGLASLVRGYTSAELGFDPMVVPAWITTILPAQAIREWSEMPTPLAQLGVLVDGITDVGFRNVLNTARRDFQIRLEQSILQDALAGNAAPPTLPNLGSLGQPMSSGPATGPLPPMNHGAPAGGVMRVEPPAGFGAPVAAPAGVAMAQTSAFAQMPPPQAPGSGPPFQMPSSGPATGPLPKFPMAVEAAAFRAQDPFVAQSSPVFPMPGGPGFQQPPAERSPEAFTAPQAVPAFAPPPAQTTILPPERPPESRPLTSPLAQPFNSAAMIPAEEGFSGEQLLGKPPEMSWSTAAANAAMASGESAAERPRQPQVIDLPPASGSFFDESADYQEPPPPSVRAFIPPRLDDEDPPMRPAPPARSIKPEPPVQRPASTSRAASSSNLGVQTHDANPDQIVLRALLDTDSDLTAQRVVELTCGLPGIAACVCLVDGKSISHIGAHKPQAREFQKQASTLAQHLRTLAPLIGIDGAETFTMNSGDRLMTFCFPEGAIFGVLHDAEPTLGLRDKITLIARELSRMIS